MYDNICKKPKGESREERNQRIREHRRRERRKSIELIQYHLGTREHFSDGDGDSDGSEYRPQRFGSI